MLEKFPTFRKVMLLGGVLSLTALAVYLALQTVLAVYPAAFSTEVYFQMMPMNLILIGILFGVYGLFSLARKRFGEIFIGVALSVFYTLVIMMAVNFFFRAFSYSRSVLLMTAVYEFILLGLWLWTMWRLERFIMVPREALVIGSEKACARVLMRLSSTPELGIRVRHIATDGAENEAWREAVLLVNLVILCDDVEITKKSEIVGCCQEMQKEVLLAPSVYELYCSGLTIDKIDDIPFFRPQYLNPSLERRSLKRILDIFFSLAALALTALPMLAVALAIKLDSKGPVFYKQVRTGRYGKEFKVYKFRSMRQDAEKASGPVMAGENDPRITKVGRFLRAVRLDELPQFINVLKGEMSVVGPRPERPFFVKQFQEDTPEYAYRHNVKPGITGLAQVYGKYNTTAYDKLVYDLMYVQHCDLFTDLVIIIQTVRVLFRKGSTEGVDEDKAAEALAAYGIRREAEDD